MSPELRKRYPKNWKQLADACREKAGKQCEHCHIPQETELLSRRTHRVYKVFLHAAHINHDPENQTPELLCLCPSCHGRYDFQHLQRTNRVKLEQVKHRILLARRGQ